MVTRMGERETSAVSGRLQDNLRELARMQLANHRPKQAIYRSATQVHVTKYGKLLISGFPNRNTACLKQLVTQHAHNHAGCDFGTPTLKKGISYSRHFLDQARILIIL